MMTSLTRDKEKKRSFWAVLKNSRIFHIGKNRHNKSEFEDNDGFTLMKNSETEKLFKFYENTPKEKKRIPSITSAEDFRTLNKALVTICEIMEEDILTENEADALIEFVIAKFIERRFDHILFRSFNENAFQKRAIRGIVGRFV